MYLLLYLKRVFSEHIARPRWYSVASLLALYASISWLLLVLCGETELVEGVDFLYWMVVTASTVGYGDLSPATPAGRLVVAFFIIPVGLSLFALAVGRLATYFASQWRKGVRGLKQLDFQNHILVIGWNDARTVQLIKLLLREQRFHPDPSEIALCVTCEIENPLPGQIGFVRVTSFSDDEEMARTGIDKARCIILDNDRDDVTMTTALYCNSRNPDAHTIAYFQDEKLVPLLTKHCPNIECTPSVAVEMMAKAAVDPGSSHLHHQLLDVDEGMTQYSLVYPAGEKTRPVSAFFHVFKSTYHATLIGIAQNRQGRIDLNPDLNTAVEPGSLIYYIADERIPQVDWSFCDAK